MTTLSATDANFLYAETQDCPMSIASLQYMALPPGVSEVQFVKGLKQFLLARLDWVPYLTNKVQFASGIWGHPNWVKAQDFDIDNHVYTLPVPAPGGLKQVEQVIARLHEQPLDRSRPLWDLVILTGLPNRQVAYYNRVHHACLDGMAAQASTQLLMDTDPSTPETKQPLPANSGGPIGIANHLQGMFEAMLAQSIESVFNSPARSAAMNRIWQRANDPARGIGAAFTPCPATPINTNIDRGRVFAAGQIPLAQIKQLAKHMHCTINDVFMAVCGGALRSYLLRRSGLPDTTLIAGCPVSMRKAGDSSNNNQVSMMRIALGTHINDHVERVKFVRRSTEQAKRLLIEARPMLSDDFTAPALGLAIRGAQLANGLMGTADRLPPPINVLISNVPGPRKPLYSNGARMLSHYPISIPTHGVGVNITVQSYTDTLYIGVTAASRSAPDADRLRDDIDTAFVALYNAMTAEIVELQHVKSATSAITAKTSNSEKPYMTGLSEQVA